MNKFQEIFDAQKAPPGCDKTFVGSTADGAACQRNEECKSTFCKQTATQDCPGVCTPQVASGADCTRSQECSGALVCSGGKCIDNPGGNTTNGTDFWYWDCTGGANQKIMTLVQRVTTTVNLSLGSSVQGTATALTAQITINTDVPFDPPHVVTLKTLPLGDQLSVSVSYSCQAA